jgi:hypothetical protein
MRLKIEHYAPTPSADLAIVVRVDDARVVIEAWSGVDAAHLIPSLALSVSLEDFVDLMQQHGADERAAAQRLIRAVQKQIMESRAPEVAAVRRSRIHLPSSRAARPQPTVATLPA